MKRSLFNRFLHPVRPGAAAGFSFTLVPLLASAFFAGPASAATSPAAPAAVPPALRPALCRAIAKDAGPAYALDKNGCATLPQSGLKACFDAKGIRFDGAHTLSLHLAAFGRGTRLAPVTAVQPAAEANRVSYKHGNLTEWWRVLPMGFEQGFTIMKRPAGHGKLILALTASRKDAPTPTTRRPGAGRDPVKTSPSIPLRSEGGKELAWGKLRYGQLIVTDANGKIVPASLNTSGDRILIAVNDARAAYPLTVDPLVWLEQEVRGSAEDHYFSTAVAVEGKTALIGQHNAGDNGLVYVFSESNGAWTETAVLSVNDSYGGEGFGTSVSLDGTTALIGAPEYNHGSVQDQGAAYVFNELDGVWTQTQLLLASDPTIFAEFGWSVALDGTTAVVGAQHATVNDNEGQGAAYVFNYAGGAWMQTVKLTASDGVAWDSFGSSVALDGTIALIGADCSHPLGPGGCNELVEIGPGAAYVFAGVEGTWTQTAKLTASDGGEGDHFGVSVALDGTTALIGAPFADVNDNGDQGAVYFFNKANDSWTQTAKLTASDGASTDHFGNSVALDGTTALVGAWAAEVHHPEQGAAYVFTEAGGTWTQAQKLFASDGSAGALFGYAVAFESSTALIGAPYTSLGDNDTQGAAYFYGRSDLGLSLSAPETVAPGANYVAQTIATNSSSAASPAVSATIAVPAAASFVSASATQGSCDAGSRIVTCDFGPIDGNAGTATADITFKATGPLGTTIENRASIVGASPPLSASAATIISSNSPPVAKDGTLTTKENKAASGTLEATDPDGDPLTFTIVAKPRFGQVKMDDAAKGTFTYTPNNAFVGGDSFTFKASDGQADSNVATIWISVKSDNHPPVAKDDTLTTDENTTGKGVLSATDPDGDRLTFAIVTTSKHGTVTINDTSKGTYTYTPDKDYIGSDSFTFKANDGQTDSNVATVTITVETGGSHPPIAHDGNLKVLENQKTAGTFPANDPDGDPLSFAVVAQPAHGRVTIDDATEGTYTYTPDKDYVGADSFTYKANDGHADSNVATISVSVVSHGTGAFGGLGLGGLLALLGLFALIRRRR